MLGSGRLRRTLYLTIIVALAVAVLPITAVSSTAHLPAAATAAGFLTAAYGAGNLAGAAGVMVRPARGEADHLMTRLALVVAAGLIAALLAPNIWVAAACYTACGISNACFFAATLAARTEYSPVHARGQIFVWVGALKITAGAAGTALAGTAIGGWPRLPLVLAAGITVIGALASGLDRRAGGERSADEDIAQQAQPHR